MNYYNYIQSDKWQEKRKQYYSSKMNKLFSMKSVWKCICCLKSGIPLDLHHRTYKRLGNEKLSDLVTVCRKCHEMIHEHYKNDKTTRKSLWKSTTVIKKRNKKNSKVITT